MKIRVDVFSDVVCPWCFVGKRRLEKAMAVLARDHEFEAAWHPFELNPAMPEGGVPRREYLARKFGGPDRAQVLDRRLKQVGAGEGIAFLSDRIATVPNTRNAHRLIWWAGQQGRQDPVVEKLFQAYFTEARDIGRPETLVEVARESGLDPARAKVFLAGDGGRREVQAEEEAIVRAGIQGVPLFVINGQIVVEGAEPAETFLQAVERLTMPKRGGGSCESGFCAP
jgi:predicted DsbA family dithiol-disulfide isomerase